MANADTKIRVLIVDDHRLLRDGLAALLEEAGDLQLVGSVPSGEEAVNSFSTTRPHVVVMDILMGGMTGIEATRWLKEQDSNVKVILISSEIRKDLVSAGIQSGIDGYVPKNVGMEVLTEAIRTVSKGGQYFHEAVKDLMFEEFYKRRKLSDVAANPGIANDLTKREREVLILVASGKSNREVADDLFVSVKTVDTHKNHILVKLGLKNTAELVKYAIRHKLINLD